jgi:hypothetical protein
MIMSIGRLLAAGRSLVGVQNTSSRYRMDKKSRLPKFGSPKNPFASEQRTSTTVQPVSPRRASPAAESVVRATPPAASPAPPAAARLRRAVRRLREWCVEANHPAQRDRRVRRSQRCASTGVPTQSELSLEGVKVMRNDLGDADLEIVPAKPVRRADAAPRREENTWRRLTTRIFVRAEQD